MGTAVVGLRTEMARVAAVTGLMTAAGTAMTMVEEAMMATGAMTAE